LQNHIKEILYALADGGVELIIGGGVASVLHGVERVTLDIDIAIAMTPENVRRLESVAHALGLMPRVPVKIQALADVSAVQAMIREKHALVFSLIDPKDPLRYLDIFLKEDLSFDVLEKDAESITVDDRTLRVISAKKLLEIKKAIQPPREKDQLDIAELGNIIRRKNLNE